MTCMCRVASINIYIKISTTRRNKKKPNDSNYRLFLFYHTEIRIETGDSKSARKTSKHTRLEHDFLGGANFPGKRSIEDFVTYHLHSSCCFIKKVNFKDVSREFDEF